MLDLRWLENEFVTWLIETPGRVVLILVIALGARYIAHRLISRLEFRASSGTVPPVLANSRAGELLAEISPGATNRRRLRARTVASLLRSIASATIFTIAFVMALDVFGLPIAPLLTGAGVVGVALGFGAQTLVKDFLSGIFMMVEDQYGVGDAVDLGHASGAVEAVGLRVTQVRDVNGTVWYVRNGEILRVGNSNQSWSRLVLDITVPFDTDLDQVYAILHEESQYVATSPEFENDVIDLPEVWGLERLGPDGAVIRTVIKTQPGKNSELGRVIRGRVLRRFDQAGIQLPSSAAQ